MGVLKTKIAFRQILWSIFLCLAMLSVSSSGRAEEAEKWVIRSEFQSPVPGSKKSTTRWLFEKRILASDGTALINVSELDGRAKVRAMFYYDLNKRLVQADYFRSAREGEICEAQSYDPSAPAIMNKTIIPGDWLNRELPFVERGRADEYHIVEKVGITGFSSHLIVEEREVSRELVIALGMLERDGELLNQAKNLCLVTVSKALGTGEEMVLMHQLWAVGDDFWLYEEKGGRRSWFVKHL